LHLVQLGVLGEAGDPRRAPLAARLHERRAVGPPDDLPARLAA
jgi:hypothetical protein